MNCLDNAPFMATEKSNEEFKSPNNSDNIGNQGKAFKEKMYRRISNQDSSIVIKTTLDMDTILELRLEPSVIALNPNLLY